MARTPARGQAARPGAAGAGGSSASDEKAKAAQKKLEEQNVKNLAKLITTEAGGTNQAAQVAVGWAARNRMLRNRAKDVTRIWGGFAHGKPPTTASLTLARGILGGTVADPTKGATHFYTPGRMRLEAQPRNGTDDGGGLESVPGVVDKDEKPVQNYRPTWAKNLAAKRRAGHSGCHVQVSPCAGEWQRPLGRCVRSWFCAAWRGGHPPNLILMLVP